DDPPYIILLTARSKTADIVEGLSKGANDYIAKPFENAELQARLQVGRRMLDLQAQLNKSKETLTFQATYDALTGLLNRGAVMKVLEQNMAYVQRQPEAALFIGLCDIDHFKRINDTHGHLTGDAVLREVARRIAAALRPYDQVGRYGGEEFLILQYTFRDQVYNPFERIRRATADTPFIVEEIS
ncbi:MAG: diguanylate cyclase, partial [Rhodobacteraceae bacterium]|nr:diguanylate cyclase [Paracoccaceae bacterium]